MKKIILTIEGVDYPCRPSMGAFKTFREETGKEAMEVLTGGSVVDFGIFLWACTQSGARHEKREFPYTLEEFMDMATPDEIAVWMNKINEASEGEATSETGSKKKKARKS